jgi:hypothetical protein
MSEIWDSRKKEEEKKGNGQIFVSFGLRNFTIIRGIFIGHWNFRIYGLRWNIVVIQIRLNQKA